MFVIGSTSSAEEWMGSELGVRALLEQSSAGTLCTKCSSPLMVCNFSKAYSLSIGGKSIFQCYSFYNI